MISFLYERTYPFISIAVIQLGQFVKGSENIFIIIIFTLQVMIAALTMWKLHGDIRNNRKKKK